MEGLREVLVGESPDGLCWVVRAGLDTDGGFYTSLRRSRENATAESGMGGDALPPGQVISTWIGRGGRHAIVRHDPYRAAGRTRHRHSGERRSERSRNVTGHRRLQASVHGRTVT